jgi:two-component system, OmpR family, sensor histidine kinase KdpD
MLRRSPELEAKPRPGPGDWVVWLSLTVLATVLLVSVRDRIHEAHVALTYLLVVLLASARAGRAIGLALAVLSFLCFNFFFLPPFYTFTVHNPLDWFVLIAFLVTSAVAAQLLYRLQAEAYAAYRRAGEIDRLATLGAENLNAARAEDAVQAIVGVIRSGLELSVCEIFLSEGEDRLRRIARAPEKVGDAEEMLALADLRVGADARVSLLPLRVRDRTVGMLRLESATPISFDRAQERFAEALGYYAALGLERMTLAREAEHAVALREADRLKDSLLMSVSHDLRTPLTTIRALAQDIAADGDERALVITEEADRLNRFVSDLLDLSRLNAGQLTVSPELVAAEDVLGAALQRVSGVAAGRDINASIDVSEPILVARLDFVHSLRALVNLLENALKYSPADAPVDVSLRREDDCVAFVVADRGPGVPPELRERIFDSFFRNSDVPDASGAGLGLSIARRLAEAQGGRVSYAPRDSGGSVFTLTLPAATPAELETMSL